MDNVWWVQNLERDGADQAFEDEMDAVRFAESYVKNTSAAKPTPCTRLYGRGDGNTVLMVRRVPREWVLGGDIIITAKAR